MAKIKCIFTLYSRGNKKGGVKDEDIIFLSSTGTHREQTEEEHKILIGENLYNNYKVIDHISTKKKI